VGALGHYFLWSVFPNAQTARAALLMWAMLGGLHLAIYAIQNRKQTTIAVAVVIPALMRLLLLPGILVGLITLFVPEVKVFVLLFVGEVFLFMGLELFLVYQARSHPGSS